MISLSKEEMEADIAYEQAKDKFLQDNKLSKHGWDRILVDFPKADGSGEFYFDFDGSLSKEYVSSEKKEQLVRWMLLTEELFM